MKTSTATVGKKYERLLMIVLLDDKLAGDAASPAADTGGEASTGSATMPFQSYGPLPRFTVSWFKFNDCNSILFSSIYIP